MRTDSLLPALCRCSSCIEFVCFQTNCSPKQLVQCSFVRFGGFVLLVTRWCYTFVLILPWPLHLDTDSIDVNRSTRSTLRSRFCWSFGVFVWRKNDTLSSSDELNSPSVEKTRTENHHRFTRALLQLQLNRGELFANDRHHPIDFARWNWTCATLFTEKIDHMTSEIITRLFVFLKGKQAWLHLLQKYQ